MSVDGTHEGSTQMAYYNLLDRKIYENINSFAKPNQDEPSPINATFGVMNFGTDGTDIILPPLCFSVLLDCGRTPPGYVRPSDSVKIMPTRTAPIFELKSTNKIWGRSSTPLAYRMLISNLAMDGMQLPAPARRSAHHSLRTSQLPQPRPKRPPKPLGATPTSAAAPVSSARPFLARTEECWQNYAAHPRLVRA
ncbi:hypothetical protein HYPSUDRAFT_51118 [Hypholoma sublateritium FD-334 SS-4]|uniref:Uncharacterized protein n=1 Tax=Hypholoma sublateritium (strain FD-334 SS-4) TaxID=945553 RepID=A0A0D2PKZ1_HYPSF|nr:hypothetical protein HYPSUDRAFT_51118 [Hypholoma sublateritium FD-334 SS-4]